MGKKAHAPSFREINTIAYIISLHILVTRSGKCIYSEQPYAQVIIEGSIIVEEREMGIRGQLTASVQCLYTFLLLLSHS